MIKNFDQLVDIIKQNTSSNKKILVVMFKSHRCPPCVKTMDHLNTINPTGQTYLEAYIDEFKKLYHTDIFFMPLDVTGLQNIKPEYLSHIGPILSAAHKIKSIPTFEIFVINNQEGVEHQQRCSFTGGLFQEGYFMEYLSSIMQYVSI